MGNCTASKLGGGDEEAVSLCRRRKRLLKAALDSRHAFSDAQQCYLRSIHAVAGAINLFVARHSAPSPILITLPSSSPSPSSSEPTFLGQPPTELKSKAPSYHSASSSSSSSAPAPDFRETGCGYLFQDTPMSPPSPSKDYEWDFFNPFERLGVVVMTGGLGRSSDEDLRVVREQEGIPELEDVDAHEEKREVPPMMLSMEMKGKEDKLVKVEGSVEVECAVVMEKKMELLDALKDVEDEFIKAYDSGKELARMLEANIISAPPEDNQIKVP